MALITCTECGKEFSDKAPACPNCGCPTSEVIRCIANRQHQDIPVIGEKIPPENVCLQSRL